MDDAWMDDLRLAERIAQRVRSHGGRAMYVGGLVRNRMMGLPGGKDVDLEIYGLRPDELRDVLNELGECYVKGAAFGVFGLRHSQIDIAMPRRERCTGLGHKDFDVSVDPFLPMDRASARRDFTVNSMMQDVLTGELFDPHHGMDDLKRRVLRHTSDATFAEDPLRVFRGAQFAARFGFSIDARTMELMRGIDVSHLSCERVFEELEKALLRAERPSTFFHVLNDCGQLSPFFDEIGRMRGVAQNPQYHPEGDVWVHTMRVLDIAARLRQQAQFPLYYMLSALMHDLGKITSSQVQPDGRITAYNHPEAGVPLATAQLARLTNDKKLTRYVLDMVRLHMRPTTLAYANARPKKTRALFDESACPEDLILVSKADALGTGGEHGFGAEAFLRERLADYREVMQLPMLTGEDLIRAGYRPGTQFKELLSLARKLHFSGLDKRTALKQLLGEFPPEADERKGGQKV